MEIQSKTRNIYIGLQKGICGALLLISELKKNGFDIKSLNNTIEINWNFLKENYLCAEKNIPAGLYNEGNGVAWTIASCIESNLLNTKEDLGIHVYNCFFKIPATSLNIEDGLAGYGLSLLRCAKYLPPDFFKERLLLIIDRLLQTQQKDGSWVIQNENDMTPLRKIGFESGVAGITFFLLECIPQTGNNKIIIERVSIALRWLKKQSRKFGDNILWPVHSKTKDGTLFMNGTFGVAVTFIKAFEVLGDIEYKEIAKKALSSMPAHAIVNDSNFSTGLSGMGEVYLYAYRIFKEKQWYDRAEWISSMFANTKVSLSEEIYWIQNIIDTPSADLMEGNGAIIHFLLRLLNSDNTFIF